MAKAKAAYKPTSRLVLCTSLETSGRGLGWETGRRNLSLRQLFRKYQGVKHGHGVLNIESVL